MEVGFLLGISVNISTDVFVWVYALLVLFIYSFLYKDNIFYKFAEHLFIGVSAGYWVVYTYWSYFYPNIIINLEKILYTNYLHNTIAKEQIIPYFNFNLLLPIVGDYKYSIGIPSLANNFLALLNIIIPTILGLMVLAKLFPKIGWVSRISIAFIIGVTAGINIYSTGIADVVKQINSTINPIFSISTGNIDWISTIIMIVGVLSTLLYFYFAVEFKGAVLNIVKIGIIFLMIGFGTAFGFTVMARASLAIQIFNFLINQWLGIKIN